MNAGHAGACFVYMKLVKLSRPFKLACAKGTITKSVIVSRPELLGIDKFGVWSCCFPDETANEDVRWNISQIRWVQGGWAGGVVLSSA